MKKQLLTLAIAASSALTMQADDLSLYLEPTTGATSSYEVATLQNMTFVNGNVVINKKDGTTITADISSLKRMYFSATTTAINSLLGNEPAPYTLYDINGVKVGEGIATSAKDLDMSSLQHGLYIVSIKNQNFKIVK